MRCTSCETELSTPPEAFTGDVCPQCHRFAHPTRLGHYENLELIKRGGMGSVYRARHPRLGTTVAIKTVHTHSGPTTLAERFEREAGLAARIPHPGVVPVYDYDCQEGRLYLVMEFVDGTTLRQQIQQRPHEVGWCLDKVAQLCDVLQAAHDQGIVHRDIKPENVMIDAAGKVRVLDFGISKALADDEQLTQPGEILGTPEYIAPEQVLDVADAVDARSDVYATGVVLYELLTGTSPFAGSNLFQVLRYVESRVPPPPSSLAPGLPRQLDELVMQAIAKDKAARPDSAAALARQLREIARTVASPVAPRAWPPLARASAGLAVALLAWAVVATLGWAGVGAGAPPAAPARDPTPGERLQALEGRQADPGDLRALAAMIPDDAPPPALLARARARLACGSLFLAWRDFERMRLISPAATRQAREAWVWVHKLVPAVLGRPRWLLTGVAPPEGDPEDDALAALMRNEFELAANRLQQETGATPRHRQLLALARLLAGDPAGARKALGELGELGGPDPVARLLRAVLAPGDVAGALQALLVDLDRLAPTRYFVEAAVALRRGDLPLFRAATELALVAGEADFATAVHVAGRVVLAGPEDRAAVFDRLRAMAGDLSADLAPGLVCTQVLLAHGRGDDAEVERLLGVLAQGTDPCLAWFRVWHAARQAGSTEVYRALDDLGTAARGGAVGRLRRWLKDAGPVGDTADLARRYVVHGALGDGSDEATEQALIVAAKSGELGAFRRFVESAPPHPVPPALLVAALRRGVAGGVEAGALAGLLELFDGWGGDLRALLGEAALAPLHPAIKALLPGGRDG